MDHEILAERCGAIFEVNILRQGGHLSTPETLFDHAGHPISARQKAVFTRQNGLFTPFSSNLLIYLWYVPQSRPDT